ncbi:hypothetical protein [Tenacibaculum discolor]|uniref:hypothetical protein n=1 Tax=Tenacibaculum discolor TaxID=361581 RepID=UPI000EB014CE|nr:hypothetical protein [Tenacibaculum discolor]RLJ97928.1 hypothetical protein C8N27_3031 [Tenacibaculum discolor]
MSEEQYNKIARLFQFLNNNYTLVDYNHSGFNGNYKTYSIEDIQFPANTLKLIEDLKRMRVQEFYDIDYLKANNFPERYYNNELVRKSDLLYGFHYQLPTILFYYLFNKLKDSAKHFLKLIDSNEFTSQYDYLVTRDEYNFKYPSSYHTEVFKYFETKILNFGMFHHLLNWLSDISYTTTQMTFYKTKRIQSCIENLTRFDFENVNLFISE